LPGTTEDIKWGDDQVFSVGGKMYAGFGVDTEEEFGFKCDEQDQLRLIQIEGIIPAPYAARFGWVLVKDRNALTPDQTRKLLAKAHKLVLEGLPKRRQMEILGAR
jgi:predicted DNA-binding protein (MmcQ/YjbR family)